MEVDFTDAVIKNCNDEKSSLMQSLRCDMLDHLCKSKEAHFKSQQIGDPELSDSEKRSIAESILDRNRVTFLARFGSFLLEKHLDYFNECSEDERYEIEFYLKRLHAALNQSVSKVKIRNRRFEAMKKLMGEGSYFSEYEMKKRNPLLYEQLIGRFLTKEEEKERTGIDTTNITFVNLLLEQYDRDEMKKLKQRQEEDEEDEDNEDEEESDNESQMNVDSYEEESDDDCDDGNMETKSKLKSKRKKQQIEFMDDDSNDFNEKYSNNKLWGEDMTEKSQPYIFPSSSKDSEKNIKNGIEEEIKKKKNKKKDPEDLEEFELSDEEKLLLMEEFRSSMFNNFLEGKDADFDYDEVDKNSDYDDLDMKDLDEQDKYFNSESPDDMYDNDIYENIETDSSKSTSFINTSNKVCNGDSVNFDIENEDSSVDKYIKSINSSDTDRITNKMKKLHH